MPSDEAHAIDLYYCCSQKLPEQRDTICSGRIADKNSCRLLQVLRGHCRTLSSGQMVDAIEERWDRGSGTGSYGEMRTLNGGLLSVASF